MRQLIGDGLLEDIPSYVGHGLRCWMYPVVFQEEDANGVTRMTLMVSPDIGTVDDADVIQTVLRELGRGGDNRRLMADLWSQTGTLSVRRGHPIATSRGKILHLHLSKKE